MTRPTPDEICERLRVRARRVSETMRVMAQAKSLRQAHNPPRDDLYMWPKPEETVEWQAADLIQQQRAEIAEARNERDALLERPITLAKMDSLDEDATDRMIAYYWCEQATEARKARDDLQATIERLNEHCVEAEMRAHQWMKAHDKLKAGKPYDLPSPADLPNALSTIERLSAALEHLIDIIDGTEATGFDPHVEQMLMDAAETARAALTKDAK